MNYLWKITVDDYLEIVKRAKNNGKNPGDSMQEELISYMKEKNQKPMGATELTKEELAREYSSHGKKILKIDTDKSGNQTREIIKPDKDNG